MCLIKTFLVMFQNLKPINMLKFPVFEINQPFGLFYVTKINAFDLLRIVESDPYRVGEDGQFTGTQRPEKKSRFKEIADYLMGVESAMPNSIIIAGNTISQDKNDRWEIIHENNNQFLLIPE
jgi:hypothetical protein